MISYPLSHESSTIVQICALIAADTGSHRKQNPQDTAEP